MTDLSPQALAADIGQLVTARSVSTEIEITMPVLFSDGESGRSYRVANVVLDSAESHPVAFILPISNRAAVGPGFAELYDLRQRHPRIGNGVVFDEHADIRAEDQELLGEVSSAMPFAFARHRLPALIEPPAARH